MALYLEIKGDFFLKAGLLRLLWSIFLPRKVLFIHLRHFRPRFLRNHVPVSQICGHDLNISMSIKVETAATEYHFDRIMVMQNNLVNRIIYKIVTLERIAILYIIQTYILQQYE